MANSIAIDALYAEKNSLIALLKDLPEDDILGKMSLESRLKDVEYQIKQIADTPEMLAETVLYFGGDSVNGSYGINIDLASDALKRYQSYVSVVHAARTQKGEISEAGPIPGADSSIMQLVATPRGSFGFVLKERNNQLRMVESSLYESVEVANALIASSTTDSEDDFDSAIEDVQPRVLKELNNFLETLNRHGASVHLVSARTKVDIPKKSIAIAASRTENIEITEKEELKSGIFLGARKHSRDFNFQPDDGMPISGKLGNDIKDQTVYLMNTEYQDKRCKAVLLRKETKRKESGRISIKWILQDIYLEDTQHKKL